MCARCSYGSALVVDVWDKGKVVPSSPAEVVKRVRDGSLSALDWVSDGITAPLPIAAHPQYRGLFLDGVRLDIPGVDLPVPKHELQVRPFWVLSRVGLVAAVAAAIAALVLGPRAASAWGQILIGLRDPVVEARLDTLPIVATNPNEEPRAALLAAAWRAWDDGTPEGLARATDRARTAAARAPADAEAQAALVFFLSMANADPQAREIALRRAYEVGAGTAALQLAEAAVALREGKRERAILLAEACAAEHPDMLPCRQLALDASPDDTATLTDRRIAYDALARDWPSSVRVRAQRARVAVRMDSPDAETLLAEVRALLPDDPRLMVADAELRFKNGDVQGAQTLARAVGERPTVTVALGTAEVAIAEHRAEDALTALAPVREVAPTDPGEIARGLLLEAQARLLRAESNATSDTIEALVAALPPLVRVDAAGAASVQVRLRTARLRADPRAGDVAWAGAHVASENRRDRARLWATRAVSLLERGQLAAAARAADDAIELDSSEVAPHVVRMAVAASLRQPAELEAALRGAVVGIDGRASRRRVQGGALVEPPPFGEAREAFERLARTAPSVAVMRAQTVLAWLEGTGGAPGFVEGDAVMCGLGAREALRRAELGNALALANCASAAEPDERAWHVARLEALVALRRWEVAQDALASATRRLDERADHSVVRDPYLDALAAEVAAGRGDRATMMKVGRLALAGDPLDVVTRQMLRRPVID